jgi:phosphoglycerate dehydrogenase-like enzyme
VKEASVLYITRIADPEYQAIFREYIPPGFNVSWKSPSDLSEEDWVNEMRNADFLLTSGTEASEQGLQRAVREAKQLKLIQLYTAGYDNIPLATTTELGIPVANIGGAAAIPVSEHALLLMLAVSRRICPNVIALKGGQAVYFQHADRDLYHQLCGKTVGIVGFGHIGRRTAKIVRGFETDVIWYDKAEFSPEIIKEIGARRVDLDELLRTSDIISLHLPLLASTQKTIGWKQFQMMKSSAIVVNTSRGEIIDEEALIRALKEKEIAGAGLDVLEKEPPDPNNPLLEMTNVVVTPHIAAHASEGTRARLELIWRNIDNVWQGKPPSNVIKPL